MEEWAGALLIRELFPDCPLKYMPPTKHVTGDIFRTQSLGTMFNLVGVATGQHIQLLSILTEAVHTPFLADRMLAIQDARRVFEAARPLRDSLQAVPGGPLDERAKLVLAETVELLRRVAEVGHVRGDRAGLVRRHAAARATAAAGWRAWPVREPGYHNPFLELWEPRIAEAARG